MTNTDKNLMDNGFYAFPLTYLVAPQSVNYWGLTYAGVLDKYVGSGRSDEKFVVVSAKDLILLKTPNAPGPLLIRHKVISNEPKRC